MLFLKFNHALKHRAFVITLLLIALAGVLFFGLRPKDYDFSNKVSLIEGPRGLQFEQYSIAYTQPFDADMARRLENQKGLTFFLNFRPWPDFDDGFGLFMVIHDGNDDEQLIIGQWQSHIIIMNGNDYAHKRRLPRISFDISKISLLGKLDSGIQLALTSNQEGTRLYVNGRLVKEKPKMMLNVPAGKGTRLILGNSPYGRASWKGNIYGLALYPGILSGKEIDMLTSSETGAVYPKKLGNAEPLLLYDFGVIDGNRVADLSGNKLDLNIPNRVVPLKKNILALPWQNFEADKGFFLDVVFNFMGFIPLGFLFSAVLIQFVPLSVKHVILMTVLSCFLLSLCIESAQAWMPSRSSSLMDLVMNSFGALVGALFTLARYTRARR